MQQQISYCFTYRRPVATAADERHCPIAVGPQAAAELPSATTAQLPTTAAHLPSAGSVAAHALTFSGGASDSQFGVAVRRSIPKHSGILRGNLGSPLSLPSLAGAIKTGNPPPPPHPTHLPDTCLC